MVIRIIFMRVFFSIVTQSHLKIGRCDRQEGSRGLTAFQADGRFFKVPKNFRRRNFSKMATLSEDFMITIQDRARDERIIGVPDLRRTIRNGEQQSGGEVEWAASLSLKPVIWHARL
jgi:hypothetical protein